MGLFNWGKEDTEAVGNAVTGTIESINYALSGDLPPDIRVKLEEVKLSMQEVNLKISQGQVEINKIEAKSTSFFKSAWRPAIGWIGVLGLFYHFLVFPTLQWIVTIKGMTYKTVNATGQYLDVPMILPSIDTAGLFSLVLGMLGIGGYRTYEKHKGITK